MNSAIERLLSLKVSDAMSKSVISISVNDSMADAARTLCEHSISGLAVVDKQLGCVGVLSAIDFVKELGCPPGRTARRDVPVDERGTR